MITSNPKENNEEERLPIGEEKSHENLKLLLSRQYTGSELKN